MPAIILIGIFLYIYCEISLLVSIGSSIGVLPLILLMILISVAGIWLIRLRGVATLFSIRQQIAKGKMPTQAVFSSIQFAIAGVLFIIPGFLSDILAILFLLPITKTFITTYILKRFSGNITFSRIRSATQNRRQNTSDSNTFDAEFERK